MPRCKVRPDGPCPASRNDRSVHSTQGDLFLCKACENYRFPPPSAKPPSTDSDVKISTNPSNSAIIIRSSSSNDDGHPSVGLIVAAEVEVIVQKAVSVAISDIKELFNNKLMELSCRMSSAESGALIVEKCMSELEQKVEMLSSSLQSVTTSVPLVNLGTAVSKAVRSELHWKKNVIITGIMPIEGKKDCDIVHNFCEGHLGIKLWLDEGKCRRVGKASSKKLLVSLNSEQAAADLITAAKQCLSQLDQNVIESMVYINHDLFPQ